MIECTLYASHTQRARARESTGSNAASCGHYGVSIHTLARSRTPPFFLSVWRLQTLPYLLSICHQHSQKTISPHRSLPYSEESCLVQSLGEVQ